MNNGTNLIVDDELCEGFGACYGLAPDLVEEAPDGRAIIKVGVVGQVDEGLLAELVESCPRAALRRVDR